MQRPYNKTIDCFFEPTTNLKQFRIARGKKTVFIRPFQEQVLKIKIILTTQNTGWEKDERRETRGDLKNTAFKVLLSFFRLLQFVLMRERS